MRKPCFRGLDRPFTIFGLEPTDVSMAVLVGMFGMFVQPVLGVLAALAVAGALRALKRGKPPGYLYALAYRAGLVALLPSAFVPPHQVRPPLPWKRRLVRLSGVGGEGDQKHELVRFYHQGRERLLG